MPAQPVISNFHQHVLDRIAAANSLAYDLAPTVEGLTRRSNILAATIQLGALVGDRANNDNCGPLNLPGQDVACWANSCLEWGRADQGGLSDWRYEWACLDWQASVDNWLAELASLVAPIDPAQAEVIDSVRDEAATMGEQAAIVTGTPRDIFDNTPTWLKLAALAGLGFLVWEQAS